MSDPFARKPFKAAVIGEVMPAQTDYALNSSTQSETGSPGALDQLLHSKSRIVRTKLEVLASEIQARFAMWDRNLEG